MSVAGESGCSRDRSLTFKRASEARCAQGQTMTRVLCAYRRRYRSIPHAAPPHRVSECAGEGAGEADLALGWFRGRKDAIPQVLGEFKDIRSKLDAKQNRKGSTRSPVEQWLNYVRGARRGLFGNEPVQPWWGLVTDMNEFRLYCWDRAPAEYVRFFIRREDLLSGGYDLLSESDDARFDRYLFAELFSRDMLLSEATRRFE